MTNRFTGEFDKQYSGVHDNGEQLTNFEVVDLLNNLSEDNEYLEKRFKEEEWHYDHIDEDRDAWRHKCQELEKENEQLKKLLECSRQEANDYCEELMGKDEFIRLYKRIRDELKEENEQLKSKNRGLQSELQIFKEDVTHSNLQINKLADENKQLKEEIKDLNDVLARYEEKELQE